MKNSTLQHIKENRFENTSFGELLNNIKEQVTVFIDKLLANGVRLNDIYINNFENEGQFELSVFKDGSLIKIEDFTTKSMESFMSEMKVSNKSVKDLLNEQKNKGFLRKFSKREILKSIDECKYVDFGFKRNLKRQVESGDLEWVKENADVLNLHEAANYSQSDIESMVSDYYGEITDVKLTSQSISDFNKRYDNIKKNSGKFEPKDLNLLLDEWFDYWNSGNKNKNKADEHGMEHNESQVPSNIKAFFKKFGYKYVGHNQKYKVYTYVVGKGRDDLNSVTATVDLVENTIRLLLPGQKEIVQSIDDLDSKTLPTNQSEYKSLQSPIEENLLSLKNKVQVCENKNTVVAIHRYLYLKDLPYNSDMESEIIDYIEKYPEDMDTLAYIKTML